MNLTLGSPRTPDATPRTPPHSSRPLSAFPKQRSMFFKIIIIIIIIK